MLLKKSRPSFIFKYIPTLDIPAEVEANENLIPTVDVEAHRAGIRHACEAFPTVVELLDTYLPKVPYIPVISADVPDIPPETRESALDLTCALVEYMKMFDSVPEEAAKELTLLQSLDATAKLKVHDTLLVGIKYGVYCYEKAIEEGHDDQEFLIKRKDELVKIATPLQEALS